MTRLDYLKQLEGPLKSRLSREEINEILRDYGEYFTEGERQGKTEWQMIANLGDPQDVANQILSETQSEPKITGILHHTAHRAKSAAENVGGTIRESLGGHPGKFLLTGLLLIVLSPLIFAAVAVLGGVLFATFAVLFSLVGASGSIILAGIVVLVTGCLAFTSLPASVTALVAVGGVGAIAGGVLGVSLTVLLIRLLWNQCRKCNARICCRHVPAPAAPSVDGVPPSTQEHSPNPPDTVEPSEKGDEPNA